MLFQWGDFTLHSGDKTWWRIDCDALSDSEIQLLAKLIVEKVGQFTTVIAPDSHRGSSVPKLRAALEEYRIPITRFDFSKLSSFGPAHPSTVALIVDDVLTSGNSMIEERDEFLKHFDRYAEDYRPAIKGAVIFARGECPDWVTPLFHAPS